MRFHKWNGRFSSVKGTPSGVAPATAGFEGLRAFQPAPHRLQQMSALNEHERNLFAVKYHLHLPTIEELQLELQRERAAIEEALALRGKDPAE